MVTTAQRSRGVCTHLHTIRIHLLSRRLCEPRGEPDGIQRDGRDHRDGRSVEQLGGVGANDEADDNARARSGGRLAVEGRARARDRARAGSTAVSAASTASTAVFTSPSPASTNPPLIAIECVSEYSRLAESGNATNTSRPTLPARSMYVAVELPSTLGLMSSAMAAVAGDAKTGASAGTAVSTAHAEPSFSAAAGATTTMVSALSTEAENSSADAANVTRAIEAAGMSEG